MAESSGGAAKMLLGRYELGRLLGRGGSAKVYLARDLRSGAAVALKAFPKLRPPHSPPSPSPTAILREVAALRRLRHPHVVRLLEVLASRSKIYFVLELARGGELLARLESRGRLPEDLARGYFHQLLSAVAYCHSRGVYHRDLKPENLLLDDAGDLKVADFGLAARPDQARGDGLFHTICGTPAYVAPEILAKRGYDAAPVDVWSCGVVLFTLAAGYLPFNDPNLMAMYRKIYRGHFRCPRWFSPELRRLVGRVLDPDPKTRITVAGIVNDPWFRKGLDIDQWTASMQFGRHEAYVLKSGHGEGRQLNAFDIIGLSSGCDLSGLFTAHPDRDRFFVNKPVGPVLNRVEEVGRREGFVVRRECREGISGVVLQGQIGNLVAMVEVVRFAEGLTLVEAVAGEGQEEWHLWKERIGPALKSLD